MTRRLLLSYLLLTGFVLLVLEIPLGFSLTNNAEHNLLSGVGHDATVLATIVEDTVKQRQTAAIAGPAGERDQPGERGARSVEIVDRP